MKLLIHDYAGHPFQIQLSRELARRGHQVVHAYAGGLVTPRGALHLRADDPVGLSIVEVPMSLLYRANKYNFLKRRGFELEYGRELSDLVQNVKPDLVISANTPTEPHWYMIKSTRVLNVPIVTWLQDFYSVAVANLAKKKLPFLAGLIGLWYKHLDSKCFLSSAGIVVITEDFLPLLERFGASASKIKTEVIPNWAPLEELPQRPRNNEWSERNGLEGKFVFHYSGTLAMKHNPNLLWRLAVHFRNNPEVCIVVVSEGPGADYLRRKKAIEKLSNLVILPFQSFEDMPNMLAASEVVIAILEADAGIFSVPSKVLTYHTSGRAILGAMPKDNLATRIISQQASGICVNPDNEDGFVEAAEQLIKNVNLRREMAGSARRYAEREFDIKRVANRFEKLFSCILETK